MKIPDPRCTPCSGNGRDEPADYVAAQSTDQGKTIHWEIICAHHMDGWNDGGDWKAPVYPISPTRIAHRLTLSEPARNRKGKEA